jgi:phosphoglycerol transferase MdoB-like AlkP superfamily enzyme
MAITSISHKDFPWKRSRSGFAVFFFFWLLLAFTVLRLVLLWKFGWQERISAGAAMQMLFIGFHQDFFVALLITLPLVFWLWLLPDRLFGQIWHRILFVLGFVIFWTVFIFLMFTEYYFFEEFKSRFNTVAVDYLLYPTEVVGNIRDSYPVEMVITVCVILSLVWVFAAFVYFRQMWLQPTSTKLRFLHFAVVFVLSFAVWLTFNPQAPVLPRPNLDSACSWIASHTQGTHFNQNRAINEIANNGSLSFVNAALSRNLDYSAFYRTLGRDEAYRRARRVLAQPNTQFTQDGLSIRRVVAGDPSRPKLNVVILLEESLGSEFWGCLGREQTLTPEMDTLALQEGLLFTNLYASGNRTVRGFEGVLGGFPPLPGDSIVKRDRSDNVETIARILKRDGYSTVFLYGGRGAFDGMRSFTTRNGYDRFLEHNPPFNDDFPDPKFTTVWGVSDEEVFTRAIKEFRDLAKTGKPFLGTVMSVSNHKPYTYPAGRIAEDPLKPKPTRAKVVKYSDWCLGQFFKMAKKEPFWTNTVFVVVADHGARVYGSQSIPIHSYEIPLVIAGPAVVKSPARIGQLGCSLDVAPTVLGLIGRPYETMFFGRDLLKMKPEEGRVFINHNRDIGMMAGERLVVLGLMNTVEFYEGNPKVENIKRMSRPEDTDLEVEKDAIAIYQVADDLYTHQLYRIDGARTREGTSPNVPETTPPTNAPATNAVDVTNTVADTNLVPVPETNSIPITNSVPSTNSEPATNAEPAATTNSP